MRKRSRTRVRSRGKVVLNAYSRMVRLFRYTQDSMNWHDWQFHTCSQRIAEHQEAAGEAERVTRMVDGEVRVVGWRSTKPFAASERPSPSTLTFRTLVAVGNDGKLSRERSDRSAIPARYLLTPTERREIEKFRVWALIGDDKAVAVRPRISAEERRLAERLLTRGNRQVPILSGMLSAA